MAVATRRAAPPAAPATTPAKAAVPSTPETRDRSSALTVRTASGSQSGVRSTAAPLSRVARPPAVTLTRPAAGTSSPGSRTSGRPQLPASEAPSGAAAATAAPASVPDNNPDFETAVNQVHGEATGQKVHPPASRKRSEVVKAAVLSEPEQKMQSSKERNTDEMEERAKEVKAREPFSAKDFKLALRARVEGNPPRTESDAKKLAKSDAVQHFEQDFSAKLAAEQGKVVDPLKQQAKDPSIAGFETPTKAVPIPDPEHAAPPIGVDPALVVPKPRTDTEVSLQHENDRLDGAMQTNRLSEDQLAQSREPQFEKALGAKYRAEQQIIEAQTEYRRQESAILQGATSQANESLTTGLAGMSTIHSRTGGRVAGSQKGTETHTEKRQREIKQTIDGIYERTVEGVTKILEGMAKKVKDDFAATLKDQTDTFNKSVTRRLDNYYSFGKKTKHFFLGEPKVVINEKGEKRGLRKDDWDLTVFPPRIKTPWINPEVYGIFLEEKDRFIREMDVHLDAIAIDVQNGLESAHALIQLGQLNVTIFKLSLTGDERRFADELEKDVRLKFANLESSIDDTREDLLQTMADQYRDSVNQLETTFKDINDELRKTWVDRAVEFIETVGKTIYDLVKLLSSILVRLYSLAWDIIKHPIRFFETLVGGLKRAIGEFVGNIGKYLQEAFWTWITGATPVKTIKLSISSGISGLFDLVMQVLRLGPAELREIVDKVLGPEFMQMVDKGREFAEKAFEPVTILFKKGPVAFWHYIEETLSTTIKSSFDRIKETVFFAFVEKGIKWIAGFFVPGGGFVKVVKAIVRAFQFVAENLANIKRFFDSVFDSMEAATKGDSAGVASQIVNGLKTGIVLALGFLARQLGLNAILDSVQKILNALRRPIVSAIEWVLRKVKPLVDKIVAGVKRAGAAARKVINWWRERRRLRAADGQEHNLYFQRTARGATVILATSPRPVRDHLSEVISGSEFDDPTKAQAHEALQFLQTYIEPVTSQPVPDNPAPALQALIDALPENLTQFSQRLMRIGQGGLGDLPNRATWRFGSSPKSASVELLSFKTSRGGTEARSGNPKGWALITSRGLTTSHGNWVRMHLITAAIGGHDKDENLLPTPTAVNTGTIVRGFETQVERLVYGAENPRERKIRPSVFRQLNRPTVVWVFTTTEGFHAAYTDPATAIQLYDAATFATSVRLKAGIYYFRSGAWAKDPTPQFERVTAVPPPSLVSTYRPNFNVVGRPIMIRQTGISGHLADEIIAERGGTPAVRPHNTFVNLLTRMFAHRRSTGVEITDEFKNALNLISTASLDGKIKWKD